MPKVKTNKEEIIIRALDTFRKNGYYNTSMNDLAQICGLQKGSFYHYFASKEELMIEVLNSVKVYLKEKVFTIAIEENLSPKKRLELMLQNLGAILLKKEGGCIIGNSILETTGHSPVFKEILKEIISEWVIALKFIYQNKYGEIEAQKLAEQTIIEFEGAVMLGKLFDNKQFVNDVFCRTIEKID